jgi:anti-sigma factor RsiW
MKACDVWQEQIGELLDSELSEAERPPLFLHLAECSRCREFFDNLQSLDAVAAEVRRRIISPAEPSPRPAVYRSGRPVASWGSRAISLSLPALALIVITTLFCSMIAVSVLTGEVSHQRMRPPETVRPQTLPVMPLSQLR